MIFWIWTAVLIAVLVVYFRKAYSRFSNHDVKQFWVIPLLGNMARLIFRIDSITCYLDRSYKSFPEERFIGNYEFLRPIIFIRDVDLVKKITIKDFEHFIDHRGFTDEKVEPIFTRNLPSLKGEEWKDMRSTLSPAFTSSKIKLMVPFMEEVGAQMIRALKKKIKESDNGVIEVDCKDLTTRYANDVIASTAFGVKVDSHTDEKNEFYEKGKSASTFTTKQILLFFLVAAFPAIVNKFKLNLFSVETKTFFIDLVTSMMKHREEKNIVRPDMIHLLMEAKKGRLTHDEKAETDNTSRDAGFATVDESSIGKKKTDRVWSDIDLVAQAMLFFLAGFETVSTAMTFALHEMAINSDVQERLYKEIKEQHTKNGGRFNYAAIQDMIYLDMVVSEVLRLWPPAPSLDRLCVKDYNIGQANNKTSKDYIIRKGEAVFIPVWSFHRDARFFPDPEKFDPERFSDENKHSINPAAYIPFGIGPRNCIGSRFALCELKLLLCQIVLHFEVSPSKKTCIPPKVSKESFTLRLEGGNWVNLKPRSEDS